MRAMTPDSGWLSVAILGIALASIALLACIVYFTQRVVRRGFAYSATSPSVFVLPFSHSHAAYHLHLDPPDDSDGVPTTARSSRSDRIQLRRYERFECEMEEHKSTGGTSSPVPSHEAGSSPSGSSGFTHRIEVNGEDVRRHESSPSLPFRPLDSVSLELEERSRLKREARESSRCSLSSAPSGSESSPVSSRQSFPVAQAHYKMTKEIAEAIARERVAESSLLMDGRDQKLWKDGSSVLLPQEEESGDSQPPLSVILVERTQF